MKYYFIISDLQANDISNVFYRFISSGRTIIKIPELLIFKKFCLSFSMKIEKKISLKIYNENKEIKFLGINDKDKWQKIYINDYSSQNISVI